MRRKLRVGLVGAGQIGQVYLEVLRAVEEAELVAVADANPETAAAAAEAHGVKGCASAEEMLQGMEIEAVVVCTPPATHAGIVQECLERGVHALCEKPLALSCPEAEGMVRAAEAKGLLLMMASKFRYVPEVMKAKGLISSGALGEIISFENTFCSHVDMRRRWNSAPEVSGGGVIIDNGTHSADIARYLLEPVAEVFVARGPAAQEIEVEDTTCILMKTVSGVLGVVQLSWSYNRHLDSFISVYGASGTLHVGWRGMRYRLVDKPDWVEFGNGYSKMSALRAQVLNFVRSIRGAEHPLITCEDALASVRLVQAAYRSLGSNRWERVD